MTIASRTILALIPTFAAACEVWPIRGVTTKSTRRRRYLRLVDCDELEQDAPSAIQASAPNLAFTSVPLSRQASLKPGGISDHHCLNLYEEGQTCEIISLIWVLLGKARGSCISCSDTIFHISYVISDLPALV